MSGAVVASFERQKAWCQRLGSPFSARLLAGLARDIAGGGVAARLVTDWPGDPVADAVALRLIGALHALVLSGQAPGLAACYPPAAEAADEDLGAAALAALRTHFGFVSGFLESAPQTNEVARSGVLLGGFLTVAAETGLPLRLLEIGASAGLNLIWDRYRYRLGGADWGDPASPVVIAPAWEGAAPPMVAAIRVASRAACDVAPVDVTDDEACLRLRAYVWADQRERLARLEGAIELARVAGHSVARADAGDWVRNAIATPAPGCVTILYHSIMWQYMPAASQDAVTAALTAAGACATRDAPVAWLRFEPQAPEKMPELTVTVWPGGAARRLAIAHPHGSTVAWGR